MMPFMHIGPITIASYGLCVGIAMLISYFVEFGFLVLP